MIELMIVLGIIAILVAIAVPAYNDYTVRSKVAECVNGAAVAKLTISEYRQTLGAWPPDLEDAGLVLSGTSHYCAGLDNYQASTGAFAIDVDEGAIQPGLPATRTCTNALYDIGGVINWVCSRGTTDEDDLKYLPSTCRSA